MPKQKILVLYGGRSGEHEVSLQSAASVIQNLDPERFEVIPVGIDKKGQWLFNDIRLLKEAKKSLFFAKDAPVVQLSSNSLVPLQSGKQMKFDAVFPVMHGTYSEDGTIQGLLEIADVPYVGSGVLGSAVGMDKDVAKRLARDAEIPIVPFICLRAGTWKKEKANVAAQVKRELGFPAFVKPANLGSSVGVHKVKVESDLERALADAFQYDSKVLIEKAVNAREIEVSILENADPSLPPLASVPGEIIPKHEFYSYEAKYLDENGAGLEIPAKLDDAQIKKVQDIARRAFQVLECEGMARVDFLMDRISGRFYFNEVNTIPGFTSISMYPKMWEASGVSYRDLLSRLIDLAVARHKRKSSLVRDFHSSGD
jgi:D-alanine-D-alanine ligase